MRTEERKSITKTPLFLITVKGFLDQVFHAYRDESSSPYLDTLSTKATEAKQKYSESLAKKKSQYEDHISAIKERLPANFDEYGGTTDQKQLSTDKQRVRAERLVAKIKTLQNSISHCEQEFEVHCNLVDAGLEVIRYSYLSGYLFHKRGGLTNG